MTTLTFLHLEGHGVGVQDFVETLVCSVVPLHFMGRKVHVGVTDGVVDGNLHHLVVAVDPEEGRGGDQVIRMVESLWAGKGKVR